MGVIDRKLSARFSRRRFLSIGAGAAAAATLEGSAVLARSARAAGAVVRPDHFGRIFPDLPPFFPQFEGPALADALRAVAQGMDAGDDLSLGPAALIANPGVNRDNLAQTAGVTFMGQFFDHDMTFDASSPLRVQTEPAATRNFRTPSFDLDSVYGGGPAVNPELYDASDRELFRIDSGGSSRICRARSRRVGRRERR